MDAQSVTMRDRRPQPDLVYLENLLKMARFNLDQGSFFSKCMLPPQNGSGKGNVGPHVQLNVTTDLDESLDGVGLTLEDSLLLQALESDQDWSDSQSNCSSFSSITNQPRRKKKRSERWRKRTAEVAKDPEVSRESGIDSPTSARLVKIDSSPMEMSVGSGNPNHQPDNSTSRSGRSTPNDDRQSLGRQTPEKGIQSCQERSRPNSSRSHHSQDERENRPHSSRSHRSRDERGSRPNSAGENKSPRSCSQQRSDDAKTHPHSPKADQLREEDRSQRRERPPSSRSRRSSSHGHHREEDDEPHRSRRSRKEHHRHRRAEKSRRSSSHSVIAVEYEDELRLGRNQRACPRRTERVLR